jgi:catalase-peroxidase
VNLTDTDLVWEKTDEQSMSFVLKHRATGVAKFIAARNDLVFGANSQLRSIVDVYACSDGQQRFIRDFIKAWDKVMMLDRYDVKGHKRYATMAA